MNCKYETQKKFATHHSQAQPTKLDGIGTHGIYQSAPPASASRALSFLTVSNMELVENYQSAPPATASRALSFLKSVTQCH